MKGPSLGPGGSDEGEKWPHVLKLEIRGHDVGGERGVQAALEVPGLSN